MYFYTKAKQNKANSVRATLIGLVGSTSSKASPTILYGWQFSREEDVLSLWLQLPLLLNTHPKQKQGQKHSKWLAGRSNGR